MLNTALLSWMSQKNYHTCYEKWFWVDFAVRKLRKLWGPVLCQIFSHLTGSTWFCFSFKIGTSPIQSNFKCCENENKAHREFQIHGKSRLKENGNWVHSQSIVWESFVFLVQHLDLVQQVQHVRPALLVVVHQLGVVDHTSVVHNLGVGSHRGVTLHFLVLNIFVR